MAHCKTRWDVLTLALFVGLAVSAVIFQYRSNQISSYVESSVLKGGEFAVLFAIYVLPVLCSYLILYFLNRFLIRVFDSSELKVAQKAIVKDLLIAANRKQEIYVKPTNLFEETAWLTLSRYWRPRWEGTIRLALRKHRRPK
jgi:hypothetical protein